MPIFDQGYQHWKGDLSGHGWRWFAITKGGVRVLMRNRWLRMLSVSALIPAGLLILFIAIWGLGEQKLTGFLQSLTFLGPLAQDPIGHRVPVWTKAFEYFFNTQRWFIFFLALLIGPSLISADLRFNALPLYLSRPLRRFDYFLGKLGIIAFFLLGVTVLPATVAYVLGMCFSLDLSIIKDTYRFLLASIAYGLVIALSVGTLVVALSSLSRNSRYVQAMWFGFWFVTVMIAFFLTLALATGRQQEEARRIRAEQSGQTVEVKKFEGSNWYQAVSYPADLERICEVLLGVDEADEKIHQAFRAFSPRAGAMMQAPGQRGQPPMQMNDHQEQLEREMKALFTPPWQLSATVLIGLFGLSLWIMTSRVKSLDRLR